VNLIPALFALLPITWVPRALAALTVLLILVVRVFERADSRRIAY